MNSDKTDAAQQCRGVCDPLCSGAEEVLGEAASSVLDAEDTLCAVGVGRRGAGAMHPTLNK